MGQPMPWNEIAAMFEPRDPASGRMAMTGEAIKQHLAKLRLHREKQGFRVPPKLDRNARRNAAAVQATRLSSAFSTPTRKKKAAGESAAKPSTLLASVSKTKQKKAEKAKKAAGGGVTKPTSAKRGRKTTISPLGGNDYVDDCDIVFDVPLFSIGGAVKDEEQSDDDDLPLSKKSKAKKVGSGLMADTLAIWEGRNAVASPVAASPPHYENTSLFALLASFQARARTLNGRTPAAATTLWDPTTHSPASSSTHSARSRPSPPAASPDCQSFLLRPSPASLSTSA